MPSCGARESGNLHIRCFLREGLYQQHDGRGQPYGCTAAPVALGPDTARMVRHVIILSPSQGSPGLKSPLDLE